jgi:hypothetical protein
MRHDPRVRFRSQIQRWSPATWAAIAFVLLAFSLSNDSIDQLESQTWDYARLGTFQSFCHELRTDDNPESQMPLGMFSAWAWARAFGTGEMAMRSINLLWAAVALAALAGAGKKISIPWLPLLFAIQPFVWYYMNRARTPVMETAGGALLLMGTIACLQRKPVDSLSSISLCMGAILLSGASMLGLIPLAAVVAGLTAHGLWSRLHWPRPGKIFLSVTCALIAVLSCYYIVRLLHEGGGSQLWRVSPANLFFVGYEFLGLQGLGPGRQALRSVMKGLAPFRELLPFFPILVIFLCAYLALFGAALKSWLTRDPAPGRQPAQNEKPIAHPGTGRASVSLFRVWLLAIGVPVLSAILLFVLAMLTGVPFWGRNLAGAFPFWVVALAITIRWARQGLWRGAGRMAASAVLILLVLSSMSMRFLAEHKHDNYKGAAAEAMRRGAEGRSVWWVADHSGGSYYGLPFAATQSPSGIEFAMNKCPSTDSLPDAVVISRPDNFDSTGSISELLRSGQYKKKLSLQAFEVWEKTSP